MLPDVLIEKLKNSKSIAVLTGSGVSAESGVATFRGENGLWKKFRPEELANVNAFMKNPDLVWDWYQYRRKIIYEVKPNPGHYALVEFEKYFQRFTLITQNVDGLHSTAGNKNIIELHGNILRSKCIECTKMFTDLEFKDHQKVPKCQCGGLIRPDVVWFGEMLPVDAINKATEAASDCDVFFSLGTSAVVYPAAGLSSIAKQHGAFVVEINEEKTSVTEFADISIQGKTGIILPEILEKLS